MIRNDIGELHRMAINGSPLILITRALSISLIIGFVDQIQEYPTEFGRSLESWEINVGIMGD